jgi:DNA-binding NarL/FixJ family response regulator
MKILIVENDSNKLAQIVAFLNDDIGIDNQFITIKRSYQSGLETILTNQFGFLILDMSLPTFDITTTDDGGETLDRGGELILQEIDREGIHVKSLILTQYEDFDNVSLEEIDSELKKEYSDFYLGCVYYNISEDNWHNELKTIIKNNLI